MLLTQELNEKLLGNRLYANIFWQASEEIKDINPNDMDLKIIINGKEIKNPIEHLERVNSLIEKAIDNFDEEVDKAAKKLIKEKYEDFYCESLELSRKIEELQNDISWRMDSR
ncbi:hypothetical protein FKF97_10235 [Clostridium perfringens]|nr:hypothetical protein [Clostridium perfringens]